LTRDKTCRAQGCGQQPAFSLPENMLPGKTHSSHRFPLGKTTPKLGSPSAASGVDSLRRSVLAAAVHVRNVTRMTTSLSASYRDHGGRTFKKM
jgi:hypothetical protein